MIRGLDHVAVAVRDFGRAVEGYRALLGREPALDPRDGAERAWFRFRDFALEVIAPAGEGAAGARVAERLERAGEGLWLAAFCVDDVAMAAKLLTRRGLIVEPLGQAAWLNLAGLDFVLTPGGVRPPYPAIGPASAAVGGLDHVVVTTPNAQRALALYGAKLGLDLRLDRENPKWGARQLFFRCGGAVFEVAAKLGAPPSEEPDRFGGLAWRVADPDAAHARIAAAGFDVSEVRQGRKPGTKVFTVRDAPVGTPTLILSSEPLPEPAHEAA